MPKLSWPHSATVTAWLQRQSPVVLAGIGASYYLLSAALLALAQFLVPDGRWLFEIVLGGLGIGLLVVLVAYAASSKESTQRRGDTGLIGLLLVVGIIFQFVRWYAEGGGLTEKLGDDDEIYILLAHQLVGLLDGQPLFSFRSPGAPLLIAGTLRLAGVYNLWAFSLVQRILLGLHPALLYVILREWLPRPFAVFGSLLTLASRINENAPFRAYSEITYVTGAVIALVALFLALRRETRARLLWMGVAGLALAWKALTRPIGLTSAPVLSLAFVLAATYLPLQRRLVLIVPLLLPTVLAAGGLMAYNRQTIGRAVFNDAYGLNTLWHIAPYTLPLSESPAKDYFLDLLPEADPDTFMGTPHDWFVARYRVSLSGWDAVGQFMTMNNELATQVIRENFGLYLTWLGRRAYAGMMFPREELIPKFWYRTLPIRPVERTYGEPHWDCSPQVVVQLDLLNSICEDYLRVRAASHFSPRLPALPQVLLLFMHGLTASLTFRLRLLTWPFSWGLLNLGGMLWLLIRGDLRPSAWVLGAAFGAEFVPTVVLGTIDTRFQFPYDPIFLLTTWAVITSASREFSALNHRAVEIPPAT